MAEVPSTHYVKSDDVYIAYQVLGEGPLDLMFVPGLCQTSRQFGNRRIEADFFGVSPPSVASSFSTSVALECPIGALRFSRWNSVCTTSRPS
jgi:hypothetical protein